MIWFAFFACTTDNNKPLSDDSASQEDTSQATDSDDLPDSGDSADSAEPPDPTEWESTFVVVEKIETENRGQLVLRNKADWNESLYLRDTSSDAIIKRKNGFLWLLNRGSEESITQYDPADMTEPVASYDIQNETPQFPVDVAICGGKVFAALYDSNDLLVLDATDLSEIDRVSMSSYADDDGLAEPASLACKKNLLYVSLHLFNRNEIPDGEFPQQVGSTWLIVDPETYDEVTSFPEQGYLSDIYDIHNTEYIGSVIRPHSHVTGTTGFWIFDPVQEIYYSQIYWAYNDKTIVDTAFGTEKVVHLAVNYYDDIVWLFCHDLSPGEDIPGYSYEELVPVVHEFVSVAMTDQDEAWLSFRMLESVEQTFMMSIDTTTCMSNNDEMQTENLILDWEIVSKDSE